MSERLEQTKAAIQRALSQVKRPGQKCSGLHWVMQFGPVAYNYNAGTRDECIRFSIPKNWLESVEERGLACVDGLFVLQAMDAGVRVVEHQAEIATAWLVQVGLNNPGGPYTKVGYVVDYAGVKSFAECPGDALAAGIKKYKEALGV